MISTHIVILTGVKGQKKLKRRKERRITKSINDRGEKDDMEVIKDHIFNLSSSLHDQ